MASGRTIVRNLWHNLGRVWTCQTAWWYVIRYSSGETSQVFEKFRTVMFVLSRFCIFSVSVPCDSRSLRVAIVNHTEQWWITYMYVSITDDLRITYVSITDELLIAYVSITDNLRMIYISITNDIRMSISIHICHGWLIRMTYVSISDNLRIT